jgi:hypothetical protein
MIKMNFCSFGYYTFLKGYQIMIKNSFVGFLFTWAVFINVHGQQKIEANQLVVNS